MFSSYQRGAELTKTFRLVQNSFLQDDGLPFADVLPETEIAAAFAAEQVAFAAGADDHYTPGVTLWAWLSQAVNAGVARSCGAAVARIRVLYTLLGRQPPTPDTGDYCRARAKLPETVLARLVETAGAELEARVPADWLWHGRHVKLVDGTTLSVPDTAANQAVWPQSRAQKPGVGFPILRMVVLFSLATAALGGLATGPYRGKETGEPALLRELLDRFQRDDIFLGDCCFCSYFLIALLLARGVDVVTQQHQRRRTDFRRGRQLGPKDHVVVWQRPQCPDWMDAETYATIPEELTVREVEVRVAVRGFRTKRLVVVTTLTDAAAYPQAAIAQLYRQRWHAELDLRNIKATLHLDDLRCKTPALVRREILVHWLAYNLIRKTMGQAALHHARRPRTMSFAAAVAAVTVTWGNAAHAAPATLRLLAETQWRGMVWQVVGERPDRVEPRAVKRRPKPHKLLTKPRAEARAELLAARPRRR